MRLFTGINLWIGPYDETYASPYSHGASTLTLVETALLQAGAWGKVGYFVLVSKLITEKTEPHREYKQGIAWETLVTGALLGPLRSSSVWPAPEEMTYTRARGHPARTHQTKTHTNCEPCTYITLFYVESESSVHHDVTSTLESSVSVVLSVWPRSPQFGSSC